MSTIHKNTLQKLSEFHHSHCVSIYIPTHVKGMEVNEYQDAIVLKNHTQELKHRLIDEKGIGEDEAKKYLSPLYHLHDDKEFWHHQSEGLAVFLAPDYFEYFHLPYTVNELSVLNSSFHLEQLIPAVQSDFQYYILAASLGKVRLFKATQTEIEEINLPDSLPQGTEKALSYYDFEQSLQHHSGSGSGGQDAIYYGQGSDGKLNEAYIQEYFRHLEDSLDSIIESKNSLIVLASVDYLHPIFKSAAKDLNIAEKGLVGNYDKAKSEDIKKESLELVQPILNTDKQSMQEKYQALAGTGKTSFHIDEIAPAAVDGRIDSLFVVKGTHKWGYINQEDHSVKEFTKEQTNSSDLVSKAAVETVLNGGHAYFVDQEQLPEKVEGADMAAIFRW